MTKEEKKAVEALTKGTLVLFDTIYRACKENADIYGVDYVPLVFLKHIQEIAIEKFTDGIQISIDGK